MIFFEKFLPTKSIYPLNNYCVGMAIFTMTIEWNEVKEEVPLSCMLVVGVKHSGSTFQQGPKPALVRTSKWKT